MMHDVSMRSCRVAAYRPILSSFPEILRYGVSFQAQLGVEEPTS